MARPSWRAARSRTLGTKRSGAPEPAPFCSERPRGTGLPAGKRRRARVSDGGTAAIGRSATSGESSSSDEADRPCRRAIHPYQRRLGNASTYALPLESLAIPSRLSRRESGSISHPRRGPGAGYKVEAGAIRAHPKLDEFATRRLEPASRCAADPRRRPLLEGEDALLPSFKAAQNAKAPPPRRRGR